MQVKLATLPVLASLAASAATLASAQRTAGEPYQLLDARAVAGAGADRLVGGAGNFPQARDVTPGTVFGSIAAAVYGREAQDELDAPISARGLNVDDPEAAFDAQKRTIGQLIDKGLQKLVRIINMHVPGHIATKLNSKVFPKPRAGADDDVEEREAPDELAAELGKRGLALDDLEAISDLERRTAGMAVDRVVQKIFQKVLPFIPSKYHSKIISKIFRRAAEEAAADAAYARYFEARDADFARAGEIERRFFEELLDTHLVGRSIAAESAAERRFWDGLLDARTYAGAGKARGSYDARDLLALDF